MTLTTSRYKELDALRGIAALVVILFHFTMEREQAKFGFELGVTGVDLFFIISGFVIFMTINKVSVTLEFAINRFTRLFPVYWTCVTFTFLLQFIMALLASDMTSISWLQYLGNLTMFQYYLGIEDIDGPYWTMLVEMLFYISMAILFSLKKLKYILPIGLTILLLSIINDVWLQKYIHQLNGIHKIFPLFTHFPLFFAGIVFYKIMHAEKGAAKNILLYCFLPLCFFTKLLLADNGGRGIGFISFTQYLFILSLYFLLFILFVYNKLRFIINRPLLFLGRISFPLYLIHHYISIKVLLPYFLNEAHLNFWLASLITFIIIVTLAAAINYIIEFPVDKKWNDALRLKFGLRKRGKK
jgi:peptidoglycan/LPS O-acetylase OafA/YrhL